MLLSPNSKYIQGPTNALALLGGVAIILLMLHVVADVMGRELFSRYFEAIPVRVITTTKSIFILAKSI